MMGAAVATRSASKASYVQAVPPEGVTMTSQSLVRSASVTLLSLLFVSALPAFADYSHARIIRLSLVQGDVRFATDVKGDPLASQTATWERAELNLPIRQGYVLSTDKGRAAVEFENGAMAFLAEGTVLEFYDLSLDNGAKTTRLILRQGTASFYVNPPPNDYFSVTGGDFTVEAGQHSSFRVDNLDDGSVVDVAKGEVSVVRKDKPTRLSKGQSLSVRAGDDKSLSVGRLPDSDDFDRWVSGREDSFVSAASAAQQYTGNNYTAGTADLYTYGAWYPIAGYGNGWRPYGVGLGWSPFSSGSWFMDPAFGMSFIGSEPWGWLPYHYGGWIYDPILGWAWTPGLGFYGGGYGFIPWSPVTGVFMRNKPGGQLGIVPVHPLDVHGKTPINLARGIFPVSNGVVVDRAPVNAGGEWKAVKGVPRDTVTAARLGVASAPTHVSRTLIGGNQNARIAYDPVGHRFVNTNASAAVNVEKTAGVLHNDLRGARPEQTARASTLVRTGTAYVPRSITPPPGPRSTVSSRGGGFGAYSRSSGSFSSAPSHAAAAPAASMGGGHPH
jgi:FecR protein